CAPRTEDDVERPAGVAIQRLAEAPVIGELRLNQLPVMRRVGVPVVAEQRGQAMLSQGAEQPAQHGDLHGRTRYGDDVRDARIALAPAQRADEPRAAIRTQEPVEEIDGMADVGWRPGRDVRAMPFQYPRRLGHRPGDRRRRRECAVVDAVGYAELRELDA